MGLPTFINSISTVSLASLALVSSSLGGETLSFPFLLEVDGPYCSSRSMMAQCFGCIYVVVVRSEAVT